MGAFIGTSLVLLGIVVVIAIIMDLLGRIDEWIDERIDRRFK